MWVTRAAAMGTCTVLIKDCVRKTGSLATGAKRRAEEHL